MKRFCLLLLAGLFCVTLSCTRDKNPASPEKLVISPDGKVISDSKSYFFLTPNGDLWSWGSNLAGQAGHGSMDSIDHPTPISSINKVIDFDSRHGLSMAADADGTIWAWGFWLPSSYYYDFPLSPQVIAKLPGVIQVNGEQLLLENGTVWKMELQFQRLDTMQTPVQIPGVENIKQISGHLAVSYSGQLVSLADPTVSAEWGGYAPLDNVSSVQAGLRHTVVLKTDGTVWAWGQNDIGQLGSGDSTFCTEPVQVIGMENVVQISSDVHANLALKADGSVWFWGNTAVCTEPGQCIGIHTPERIETNGPVAYINTGFDCILIQQDGTLWTFNTRDRIVHEVVF